MPPAHLRHALLLSFPLLTLLAGCNYVHFGRIDPATTDAALASENSDLRMERKLLKEELTIARKEGDTLRSALERMPASNASGSAELVAKLNETTRELASLRASYARLQSERERSSIEKVLNAPAADSASPNTAAVEQLADLKTRMGETEEKLASTLRNFTELQQENERLRSAIDQTRAENATLTTKVEQITAQNDEARSALSQLNTELLAQKEARTRAEQNADALRAQLHAVAGGSRPEAAASFASARETSAGGARDFDAGLQVAQAPASSTPTATLGVSPEKLRAAQSADPAPAVAATPEPPPASPAAAAKPAKIYIVRSGDTLEKIAEKFYGRSDRWRLLYAANNTALSGGRPLKPGMELEVPEE